MNVTDHAVFGKVAVTGRDTNAGEVIDVEKPLFSFDTGSREQSDVDFRNASVMLEASPFYKAMQAFDLISEDLKEDFLTGCLPEGGERSPRTNVIKFAAQALADGIHGPRIASLGYEKILNILLIFDTNSQRFGCQVGFFRLGSRISHSCAPNAVTRCTPAGDGILYRALTSIKAGDLITVDYLGGDTYMQPTPRRRNIIERVRFFKCMCSRCTGVDYVRGLRCPKCGKHSAAEGLEGREGGEQEERVCFRRDTAADASPSEPWECATCKSTFSDKSMPILEEEELSRRISDLDRDLEAGLLTLEAVDVILQRVVARIGTRHHFAARLWLLTIRAASLECQKIVAPVFADGGKSAAIKAAAKRGPQLTPLKTAMDRAAESLSAFVVRDLGFNQTLLGTIAQLYRDCFRTKLAKAYTLKMYVYLFVAYGKKDFRVIDAENMVGKKAAFDTLPVHLHMRVGVPGEPRLRYRDMCAFCGLLHVPECENEARFNTRIESKAREKVVLQAAPEYRNSDAIVKLAANMVPWCPCELNRCSCRAAFYCSEDCRLRDISKHKPKHDRALRLASKDSQGSAASVGQKKKPRKKSKTLTPQPSKQKL